MIKYKELTILIAEDDDGHADLIMTGLKESGICNHMIRFIDGKQTWDFISGQSKDVGLDKDKSYLLLLDINMPKMDGVEVLEKIKSNDELKKLPVLMLTTTDDPREVEKCYALGCNIYVTKPVDFLKFAETLKRLGLFMQIVKV
ncbi:MAG: response regulator [Reichenbachiella sp.]